MNDVLANTARRNAARGEDSVINHGSAVEDSLDCRDVVALLQLRSEHDGRFLMPGKKHLHGVSAKEQREYEHIKQSAQRSGRYGGRAKEVAARTVMKQHKAKGHRPGQ